MDTAPMEWCWKGQGGKELLRNAGAGVGWEPVILPRSHPHGHCVIIVLLISFLSMAFEEKSSLWMDGKGDTREKTAASVLREQWGEPQIDTDWLGDTCVPSGINPCFLL